MCLLLECTLTEREGSIYLKEDHSEAWATSTCISRDLEIVWIQCKLCRVWDTWAVCGNDQGIPLHKQWHHNSNPQTWPQIQNEWEYISFLNNCKPMYSPPPNYNSFLLLTNTLLNVQIRLVLKLILSPKLVLIVKSSFKVPSKCHATSCDERALRFKHYI